MHLRMFNPLSYAACTDGSVLLYNGSYISDTELSEGTVLVCYNDSYGTVCDDYWDELEATVVCNQLQQTSGSESYIILFTFYRRTGLSARLHIVK